MALSTAGKERVHTNPSISLGDLLGVFNAFFALHGRDLGRFLDQFANETWKTAPKAWGCFSSLENSFLLDSSLEKCFLRVCFVVYHVCVVNFVWLV